LNRAVQARRKQNIGGKISRCRCRPCSWPQAWGSYGKARQRTAKNIQARHQRPDRTGDAGQQRGPVNPDSRFHETRRAGGAGLAQSFRERSRNFAAQKNVLDSVLRTIPMKRKFAKNYIILRNVVHNPRTPLDASLPLVKNLLAHDLKNLAESKDVSETIRKTAMRLYRQRLEKKG
jgi:hypothetical protein